MLDVWAWVRGNAFWSDLAFYLIVGGIVGGVVAAPFGLVDWLSVPRRTRARAVGAWHGIGNVVVLGFFALSAVLRLGGPARVGGWPLVFALLGTAVALVTAWLGGELVVRLGVGVDPGAHIDAPELAVARSRAVGAVRGPDTRDGRWCDPLAVRGECGTLCMDDGPTALARQLSSADGRTSGRRSHAADRGPGLWRRELHAGTCAPSPARFGSRCRLRRAHASARPAPGARRGARRVACHVGLRGRRTPAVPSEQRRCHHRP